MVIMRPSNTLQFQCFWDFNKCLGAIFSQLSFENFWLYILGEVAMTQNYFKSPLRDRQEITLKNRICLFFFYNNDIHKTQITN